MQNSETIEAYKKFEKKCNNNQECFSLLVKKFLSAYLQRHRKCRKYSPGIQILQLIEKTLLMVPTDQEHVEWNFICTEMNQIDQINSQWMPIRERNQWQYTINSSLSENFLLFEGSHHFTWQPFQNFVSEPVQDILDGFFPSQNQAFNSDVRESQNLVQNESSVVEINNPQIIEVDSTPQEPEKNHSKKIMKNKLLSKKNQKGDLECGICYGKMKKGSQVPDIRCEHSFHFRCLKRWASKKDTCPMCRRPVLRLSQ